MLVRWCAFSSWLLQVETGTLRCGLGAATSGGDGIENNIEKALRLYMLTEENHDDSGLGVFVRLRSGCTANRIAELRIMGRVR